MKGWGKSRIAALAGIGALLLLALGGCGGSDSDGGASTAAGERTQANGGSGGAKAEGGGSKNDGGGGSTKKSGGQGSGGSGGSGAKVEPEPLKVPGGGSAQYRVKGGDNSVQEFGEESDEAELEEAATALHDYLVARAEEDWPAACANLAKTVKDQLQSLASRSEELKGKGCAATLEALTPKLPRSVRRETTIVEAGSLRVEGEQGFLLYRGAEGKTYTVLMTPEDGWKVGSLGATAIS